MRPELTHSRLLALLRYDATTGVFTRAAAVKGRYCAGSETGSVNRANGYVEVYADGRPVLGHRLAWFFANGEWPDSRLTFRDGDKANIALDNLVLERQPSLNNLPVKSACSRVRDLLDYDRLTGALTSRVNRWTWRKGDVVGSRWLGYILIGIDGGAHMAHRLAWLHHHGTWPVYGIDHIDGVGDHNWLENLRDVPQRVNSENQRVAHCDNQSGVLGAHFRKDTGKFASSVKSFGKAHLLGSFDTAEQAHQAYVAAKRQLHEGCTL
jgi:hypothetical protein